VEVEVFIFDNSTAEETPAVAAVAADAPMRSKRATLMQEKLEAVAESLPMPPPKYRLKNRRSQFGGLHFSHGHIVI